MKILLTSMQFGRGYRQGTERYLADLGAGFRDRGHDVACLAGDPERRGRHAALGEAVEANPPVLAYPSRGWMGTQGVAPERLAQLLGDHRPDVVHIANPAHIGLGGLEAAARLGIPSVITTMDFWWVCPKATLRHFTGSICEGRRPADECVRCVAAENPRAAVRAVAPLTPLTRVLLRLRAMARGMPPSDVRRWFRRDSYIRECLATAGHVIFPSSATEAAVRPLLSHNRCTRIGYGLGKTWFEPAKRPRRSATDPPTIGFAGALAAHKGPHLLLDAAQQLAWQDVTIRLAGPEVEPAYAHQLRERASGLRVQFCGSLPPEQMPEFLRSVDVLVVPSTWPENSPYVVLEAHAVGTPVLASRVGGIVDIVPEASRLFAPGDVGDLAGALARWRGAGPAERAAVPRVRTVDEMVEATLDLYEAVRAG
jgi:glycosyltransferase involved in cell wall biosynthesis